MNPSSSNSFAHPLDRLVAYCLSGGVPLLFFTFSLVLGFIALNFTAREEEPQIVVPMVDVTVLSPGLSAGQVERQVTIPIEKLLAQIIGVENVYSTSTPGRTTATLRFYVGENREDAILNTYNKLLSNQDVLPKVVSDWIVKPVEVDDVPILLLSLWSSDASLSSDFELRRIADEMTIYLQAIRDTSLVNVVGGRSRTIRILLKPESLAARQSASTDVIQALQLSNVLQRAGHWSINNEVVELESGDFIRTIEELENTVINVINGVPVFLRDVATIQDGPGEVSSYSWLEFSSQHPVSAKQASSAEFPMVTISVAKKRGSNAVQVAKDVHKTILDLKTNILPPHVNVEVIRDYGETANKKVDNLTNSLGFAVLTVVVFIAIFLGWRPALVIGLAVPISYGITLALDMAFGYTINRVTLFALILSLGLLVDDPITGVDNIERYYRDKVGSETTKIVGAISELKMPLVMSTLTIIIAFLPLAFITGMMGPYMAPMAFNVPVSVFVSTLVAFFVTPWLAKKILRPKPVKANDPNEESGFDAESKHIYHDILSPILESRKKAKVILGLVLVLFVITATLPLARYIPIKLLPFDNKNEIQIVIDLPEGSTLESTAKIAKAVSKEVLQLREVLTVASFVGQPSPIDFNGLVRQYYQRQSPNLADLRITLVDKEERVHQSHGIVLRLQKLLSPLAIDGINIKVVEVPPGPPVMSTIVAEVYGSKLTPYSELQKAAQILKARLGREAYVVEVDTSVEDDHRRLRFVTDKQKAAISGISTADINETLYMANQGSNAGFLHMEREAVPLPLEVRLALADRSSINQLQSLQVKGRSGIIQNSSQLGLKDAPQALVAVGELGEFVYQEADKSIHRKDLRPVVYVTAEVQGRTPAEIIADVNADQNIGKSNVPDTKNNWQTRNFLNPGGGDAWQLPNGVDVNWRGEGEWKITIDVFRDMGIAFAFALVGIFMVLKTQTSSVTLSLIIMSAIPLTIIGILPGFFALNHVGERMIAGAPDPVLFTATAMIGMIALAGIVVRNSLILVEFITQARESGLEIKEALLQAGAIRMRPILLTAGTTLLGNLVITLDPVFSGLAIAIIFGIIASTLFTLLVVPIVYLLVFEKPAAVEEDQT